MDTHSIVIYDRASLEQAKAALSRHFIEAIRCKYGIVLTIERETQQRTHRQLRQYWRLLRHIAEATNRVAETLDVDMRRLYLGQDENGVPLSNGLLDVGSFNDFLRKIEAHAASEWGVTIDWE